jgi:hypothetical protein
MNFLLVLGHGFSPEFLLFVLGLLLGLPILVLVSGISSAVLRRSFLGRWGGVPAMAWIRRFVR